MYRSIHTSVQVFILLRHTHTHTHPPAAAACRHVLPSASGVWIWKPADRAEDEGSLLRGHIMLYLLPTGGDVHRERGNIQPHSRENRQRKKGGEVEKETAVNAGKHTGLQGEVR